VSADPRDARLRCSAFLEAEGARVIVDTSPEFRLQCLRAGIESLDAILLTHDHADHIAGLDDVRAFTCRMDGPLPVYAEAFTLETVRRRFEYIFERGDYSGWLPEIELRRFDGTLRIGELAVEPLRGFHGTAPVTVFRFGSLAYVTDIKSIPEATLQRLEGIETLVIEGLRKRPHNTHLNLEEALAVVERLTPRQTWLTHITHDLLHARDRKHLPDGVDFSYDGLSIEFTP